jgi:cell wall-associated NlpC family hydrolase
MPRPLPMLKPGDVLLYGNTCLMSRLIQFRTWSDVSHVEVYMGRGYSAASRNGIGVDIYPFRSEGLRYARRPQVRFNDALANAYARKMKGTPYGWGDLGKFYLLNIPGKGLICSQYGDLLLRSADVVAFDENYFPGKICPRDFLITPMLKTVWSYHVELQPLRFSRGLS